jgi:hypothetical protein
MNHQPIKKTSPLATLIALGRKMRSAQIAYEEKRGHGSLVRVPLQVKAEKLEAEFDQLLDNLDQ